MDESDIFQFEFDDLEKGIKEKYIKNINTLISEYEIYNHDLHPRTTESIVILLQSYADARNIEDRSQRLSMLVGSYSQCLSIMRDLYLMLIDVYMKRIKTHRKFNMKFNVRGVYIKKPRKRFIDVTEREYRELKRNVKAMKIEFRSRFGTEDLIKEPDIAELSETYNKVKKLLGMYEEYASKVISSGYCGTLFSKASQYTYVLVSLVLAILALISYAINF